MSAQPQQPASAAGGAAAAAPASQRSSPSGLAPGSAASPAAAAAASATAGSAPPAAAAASTASQPPAAAVAAVAAAAAAANRSSIHSNSPNVIAQLEHAVSAAQSSSASAVPPAGSGTASPAAAAASASQPAASSASTQPPSSAGSSAAPAVSSLVTQVRQSAVPMSSSAVKSSIEAAKRRVAKLEVGSEPASDEQQQTQPQNTPAPKTPAPSVAPAAPAAPSAPPAASTPAPAPSPAAQQPAAIAAMDTDKPKKSRASGASFWSSVFPCCCAAADDDSSAVAMAPVSKTLSPQPQKQPPSKAKPPQESRKWLLKPLAPEDVGRKCLVLDLDETLLHSSFKPVAKADFIIPVEIDKTIHNVYVLKRPGVDTFLQRLGPQFEVVVFTASLAKYADPVLDMLDKHRVVKHRLFREACIHHKGNYVKDLSLLGRDLKDVIIIDNSPSCYMFHPANAIPISTWFDDPNDTELLDLIPFLEDLKLVDNVTVVLDNSLDD